MAAKPLLIPFLQQLVGNCGWIQVSVSHGPRLPIGPEDFQTCNVRITSDSQAERNHARAPRMGGGGEISPFPGRKELDHLETGVVEKGIGLMRRAKGHV